ncbi:MAG TPA: HD-GYP domain-containing protein [bacterium]|nr:HD-GYP domain-containing protein [bacterium]HPN31728.1 HD-GYP domain-containing protein [bacterium]
MEKLNYGKLLKIIEDIAAGIYSNDIMEFARPEYPDIIRRIAEAVGMTMVKVEARETRLELLLAEMNRLNETLRDNIVKTVASISNTLGARDKYTEGHAARVAVYSERLARKFGLPENEIYFIRIGGMLHDIGKIGFSDRLFGNEDAHISEDLYSEIKKHPTIGYDILKNLNFLGKAVDFVLYHHERIDGNGYPSGLKGGEIPLGARIISVCDCFDAITSNRPYQKSKTINEAFNILNKIKGTQLDFKLTEIFIEDIKENGICNLEHQF